jgi:hypothetical protein
MTRDFVKMLAALSAAGVSQNGTTGSDSQLVGYAA